MTMTIIILYIYNDNDLTHIPIITSIGNDNDNINILYDNDISNIPIITSMDIDNDNDNDINDNDLSTFIQYCKWKRTHINYRWYTHINNTCSNLRCDHFGHPLKPGAWSESAWPRPSRATGGRPLFVVQEWFMIRLGCSELCYLSIYLSIHLSIYLSIYLSLSFICLSV